MNPLTKLLAFLNRLEAAKIAFGLKHLRDDSITVIVSVPGARWEVEFFDDAHVEIEIFRSDGGVQEASQNDALVERLCADQHPAPATDLDQERVVQLLILDLHATVGVEHSHLAVANSIRLRQFIDEQARYVEAVVESTQQDIHDEFIDTSWPKCPRHKHPMWFRDGAWCCQSDGTPIAALGTLATNR